VTSGELDRHLDRQKVAAARVWAAQKMPYLASALFAAQIKPAAESRTVAIDRYWNVHADPVVVDDLPAPELGRLLLHLIAHLLRDHAGRADDVSPSSGEQWNRCADAEVNDDLPEVPRTASTLPAELGCRAGRLVEEYYRDGRTGTRVWDCGSGADGVPRPGDAADGLQPAAADLVRLSVAAETARAAREFGNVPAGWARWAEQLAPSKVDWRRQLAAEIRRAIALVAGRVDYSYRHPSRRAAAAAPAILPTLVQPVPDVAVVCDTSGSMSADLLARALAEVESMLTRGGLAAANLRVLAVDTTVHAVRRVSRASQVVLAGGGGTDMGSGITAAAALRPRPSIVIVLTDGFTPWPHARPRGVRVIVGLLGQPGFPVPPAPPWARTILIEPDAQAAVIG
jgi:predicted metal-dependent peptidase